MAPTAERTGGKLEWFFFIIVLPLLFISLLAFILLWFLDYDVKEKVLASINEVPVIEKLIPDDIIDREVGNKVSVNPQLAVTQLQQKVNEKDTKVTQLELELGNNEEMIKKLNQEIETLKGQLEEKKQTEEERIKEIDELAKIYENMSAKNAAKIMSTMVKEEAVLILSEMGVESKSSILEKMDSELSATLTSMLKDQTYSKDKDIEALQKRIEVLLKENEMLKRNQLTYQELSKTFTTMNPQNAAQTLLAIYDQSPQTAFLIVAEMESSSRSVILNQIDQIDSTKAADFTLGILNVQKSDTK